MIPQLYGASLAIVQCFRGGTGRERSLVWQWRKVTDVILDEWRANYDPVRCFLKSMVLPWPNYGTFMAEPAEEGHWCESGGRLLVWPLMNGMLPLIQFGASLTVWYFLLTMNEKDEEIKPLLFCQYCMSYCTSCTILWLCQTILDTLFSCCPYLPSICVIIVVNFVNKCHPPLFVTAIEYCVKENEVIKGKAGG